MEFSEVKSVTGFFKDQAGGKWIMKIKSLHDNIKLLFGLNTIQFQVAEGEEVYKFTITTQDSRKIPLGWIVYYPTERILEIFDASSPEVMFRFRGKQVLVENVSPMLSKANVKDLFKRLTNVI